MRPTRPLCLALVLAAGLAQVACGGGYGRPTDPSSQLAFGVAMARRGLWSEAYFRFDQARRLDPGNANVVNNMAVAAEALGRFERARELYQEALEMQPGNAEARRNFARFIEFYRGYQPAAEGEPETGVDPAPESATEDG